jgi:hypothetical protein
MKQASTEIYFLFLDTHRGYWADFSFFFWSFDVFYFCVQLLRLQPQSQAVDDKSRSIERLELPSRITRKASELEEKGDDPCFVSA